MTKWIKKSKGLAVAFAIAFCAALPQAADAQAWSLYTYMSVPNNVAAEANMKLAEEMAKATNNELKIRVHLGGSLAIKATNIGTAVADNVVQMGDDVFAQGAMPITGLLRLPMLIQTEADLKKVMAIMAPYIERAYEERGIVLLASYAWPHQILWSRNKLSSLADVRGQKLRTTSPAQNELIKRLGGVAITMGTPEVSMALERGVVDGSLTGSAGGAYMWKDKLKYAYRLQTGYVDGHIIVNKGAFLKLKPEVQATLKTKASQISENLHEQTLNIEIEREKLMAKDGTIFAVPTAAEVKEAEATIKSYWAEWAKSTGPEAVEALVKVRAAVGR
jgi:TRAP-type C4-dicarboxylate transport system substrate-binding protein